jgi:hypothetical protein
MTLIAFWCIGSSHAGVDEIAKPSSNLLEGVQVSSYCYEIPNPALSTKRTFPLYNYSIIAGNRVLLENSAEIQQL